ncbi:alpha/beta hydrolase [Polymorphospora sp. NPDC050346]|uniref:alpha/beta fold hydrolase n=1 Tax=Polymorphospora sp. NPDC050346 TaxID=3155780 RepID=UPI0033DBC614
MTTPRGPEGTRFVLEHRGTPVRGRVLPGDENGRDVVLIHGAGAHGHWWDAMLGHVGRRWRATVFDLSGHGESGHRSQGYGGETWASEVASVIRYGARSGSATLVAHSMGGLVGAATAALYPQMVDELVLLDVGIRPPRADTAHQPRGRPGRERTVHVDIDTAISRFRLVPSGSTASAGLVRDLASRSYERIPQGWRVRFDPAVFQRFTDAAIHDWLGRIDCPVTLVGGALSPAVTEVSARYVAGRLGRPIRWGLVPAAHHHVQLDRPGPLADLLVELLDGGEPSGLRRVG